jgi:hypothetical protein
MFSQAATMLSPHQRDWSATIFACTTCGLSLVLPTVQVTIASTFPPDVMISHL